MKTMNALDRLRVRAEPKGVRPQRGGLHADRASDRHVRHADSDDAGRASDVEADASKANETSAMQSVRTIGQAQLQYNSQYPANGFSCSLATAWRRSQVGSTDGAGGTADRHRTWPPATKSGYTFAITNCNKVTVNNQDMYTSYEITAVPETRWQDRAITGFCADENNTHHASIPPAEPTAPSRSSNAAHALFF